MDLLQIKQQDYTTKQTDLLSFIKTLKNEDGSVKALTAENDTELKRRKEEITALKSEIERLEALSDLERQAEDALKTYTGVQRKVEQPGEGEGKNGSTKAFTTPARARYSSVKYFKDEPGGLSKEEQAFRFGSWALAAIVGRESAMKFCKEAGVSLKYLNEADQVISMAEGIKALRENVNVTGGALIPDEFSNTMIDLREQFGKFRTFANIVPMVRDTKTRTRRTGGLSAYWVGEGQQIPSSSTSWNNVKLVAKKLAAIAFMSTEVNEDAVIDLGDWLAKELAYAFSKAEDDAGFNGDGTSTYGRVVGIRQKLLDVNATISLIKGLIVASSHLFSGFVLGDFTHVVGRLPQYAAEMPDVGWLVHREIFYSVMYQLALSAGGVNAAEVLRGDTTGDVRFLNYPVHFIQNLPNTDANSQIAILFGSVAASTDFGDRRQITLATSDQFHFDTDELALKGTERVDINVHDVGDTTNAGPIIGLISAAS